MKSEQAKRIMSAVCGIDDKFIAEADLVEKTPNAVANSAPRAMRYAMPLAACLIIAVAIAVPVFRHLWLETGGTDVPVASPSGNAAQSELTDNTPVASPSITPGHGETSQPPSRPQPLLVIADAESMTSAAADVAIGFTLELTEAQIKDIFPLLGLTLGATCYYSPDGSLYWVTALETQEPARLDLPVIYGYWSTVSIQVSGPGYRLIHCDVVLEGTDNSITDVYGVDVSSFKFQLDENNAFCYQSTFKIGDAEYCVGLCGVDEDLGDNRGKAGAVRLTEIVYAIIAGGEADFSPIATAEFEGLLQEQFSLERAYADPDFGAFFPRAIPSGYEFASANRVCNPNQDSLTVQWSAGMGASYFQIEAERSAYQKHLGDRIVHPDETEKYDLSLYPSPRFDSIPAYLLEAVANPVFLADEITFDIVNSRTYEVSENGEPDGESIRYDKSMRSVFSVLYGDVLVNVWTKGLTSEMVWNLIEQIDK